MIKGQKFVFLTFSDSRFDSWKRLKKEAKQTGWFDTVVAGDERLFEKWYSEKYKDRFTERGYGYWQWKSYLIRRELDKLDENDLLLYCDGGCCLNRGGEKQLINYINQINEHVSGILCFEQGLPAGQWTKADVFDYFGVLDKEKYINGNQVCSCILLIRKCEKSCALVDRWFYMMHDQHHLATDKPSHIQELPQFIENRHDQSVLDVLTRMNETLRLPDSEIYRVDEDWGKMVDKPIWAARCRCPHVSFFKRLKCTVVKLVSC